MIRVALLDAHPAVLTGLRRLVEGEPDMLMAAAAPAAPLLAKELGGLRPDVLVLDHATAHGDGLAHCVRVKSRPSPPAVVIYSAYVTPALALAARVAQADALVDKAAPVVDLLRAIRRVANGATALPAVPLDAYHEAVGRIADPDLPVLAMLLDREPVGAIAEVLNREDSEIAWRARRILHVLDGGSRTGVDDRGAGRQKARAR